VGWIEGFGRHLLDTFATSAGREEQQRSHKGLKLHLTLYTRWTSVA
jgi:hypothetical protein